MVALHSEIFVFCTWIFGPMEKREAMVADCSMKTGGKKRRQGGIEMPMFTCVVR